MITAKEAFQTIRQIKSATISTVYNNTPHSRIIDIMDCDESGLYFTTLKSKPFYKHITSNNKLAITVMTPDYIQVRVNGEAITISKDKMDELLNKNPGLVELFPDKDTLNQSNEIYYFTNGHGEVFDLSGKSRKLIRHRFSFGNGSVKEAGCHITEDCIHCGKCVKVCPFDAITPGKPYVINPSFCDECGICYSICPAKAITLPTGM